MKSTQCPKRLHTAFDCGALSPNMSTSPSSFPRSRVHALRCETLDQASIREKKHFLRQRELFWLACASCLVQPRTTALRADMCAHCRLAMGTYNFSFSSRTVEGHVSAGQVLDQQLRLGIQVS
eukprot:6190146-Pleurochrysis_carterae.AAC.2